MESNGGELVVSIRDYKTRSTFADRLRRFNGTDRWGFMLWALPPGFDDEVPVTELPLTHFLQAGGSAEAVTLQIRKPGGQQWGVDYVKYAVGHPHPDTDAPAVDVAIPIPAETLWVTKFEVFEAEEAADLFFTYYKTNDIPPEYTLRPLEGYTTDRRIIDIPT
jgi:hypothetical protein